MHSETNWLETNLALIPDAWRPRVERAYHKKIGALDKIPLGQKKYTALEQSINGWLSDTAAIFGKLRFAPDLKEEELRSAADQCAAQSMSLAEITPGVFIHGLAALRVRLENYVGTYGITPPPSDTEDRPAIARMTCRHWWRRSLRKVQARQLEHGAIALAYVHRNAQIYASNATVQRRTEQRRKNAAMLADTTATNLDTGDVYTLAQLAALSVANPSIRRGELMARINGFESVAKSLGHIAEFVTLTCPSRFHAMKKLDNGRIVHNSRHDNSSPREAQQYLSKVWARLRAKLARTGLRVYGFRIAEPHHDACPHWHLILFMPTQLRPGSRSLPRFRAMFRRYALLDTPDEPGAQRHRVKFLSVDWSRGTAAGYVLKYIAKNIDGNGYTVQGDLEKNHSAIYPAQRVEAWASTWGIRQFQQIGGPPVGVWRELRRIKVSPADAPEVFEQARAAADVGSWSRYVELQGGPTVARKELPLRVAFVPDDEFTDQTTGEVIPYRRNAYGEPAAPRIAGIRYALTVAYQFGIVPMLKLIEGVVASIRYAWEISRPSRGFAFVGGEPPGPRTCVNNCTRPKKFFPDVAGKLAVPMTKAERETRPPRKKPIREQE